MTIAGPPQRDFAVVKLGGSLAFSPYLRQWLAACRTAASPLVVVPGGGPFADTVREAQARMALSDSAAHRMALLAMAQFAEALASLEPGFTVAQGFGGIEKSLDEGTTPIWAPLELLAGGPGIEESWDVTSDSLGAWLASAIGASRLVLVKQVARPDAAVSFDEAAAQGVVDRAFPIFMEDARFEVVWLGADEFDRLDDALTGHITSFTPQNFLPPRAEAAI